MKAQPNPYRTPAHNIPSAEKRGMTLAKSMSKALKHEHGHWGLSQAKEQSPHTKAKH